MGRKNVGNTILASAAVSIICSFLGLSVLVSTDPPRSAVAFGAFLFLYGVVAFVLLGAAWLRRRPVLARVSIFSGFAFFATMAIGSLDAGVVSGLEWLMLAIVGGLLWLQFVAIRRLVHEPGVEA